MGGRKQEPLSLCLSIIIFTCYLCGYSQLFRNVAHIEACIIPKPCKALLLSRGFGISLHYIPRLLFSAVLDFNDVGRVRVS